MTEDDLTNARREGEALASERWSKKLDAIAATAAATGKFAAPDIAIHLVGDIPRTKAGDVDMVALRQRVDEVLVERPELGTRPNTPPATMSPGARGTAGPGPLRRSDLWRMRPEDISQAFDRGELDNLLNGKIPNP